MYYQKSGDARAVEEQLYAALNAGGANVNTARAEQERRAMAAAAAANRVSMAQGFDFGAGAVNGGWPVDPALVRSQLEYYFSDENLSTDSYLRSFIMPQEGWVSLLLFQEFPRIRSLGADIWALRQVSAESVQLEMDATGMYVRILDLERRRKWATTSDESTAWQ
uniref:HTH La-type RNA-binding domain-containing protein n=1 Tax=Zooxanthella nutricula TaxID=1333877 RepID=A0A6U6NP90_9DINO